MVKSKKAGKKRGRKPATAAQRAARKASMANTISVRFSPDERETLEAAAKSEGMPLRTFIQASALAAAHLVAKSKRS